MAPAMKRPAAAVAPAAKKAKAAPVVQKDARLVKLDCGIQQSSLERDAKQMLIAMAPEVLLVPKEERDAQLQKVVDMFSSTLEGVRTAMDAEIQESQRLCDEAQGAQESQQGKIDSLTSELEAQSATVKERTHSLADVARAFRAARDAVDLIQKEGASAELELAKAKENKAALEAAVASHFQPLLQEVTETAKEEVEKLTSVLNEHNFDNTLVTSLPTPLLKEPASRGSFDMMILSQFQNEVATRTEAYAKVVEEADGLKVERDRRLQAAQGTLAQAKARQLEAANSFTEAKDAETRGEEALKAAKSQLAQMKKEARKLSERLVKAQKGMQEFIDGPMAAFVDLRDLAPKLEKEPSAEEEADGVAAEEAAHFEQESVAMEPVAA